MLVLIVLPLGVAGSPPVSLEIRFIDVGQGDAVLIREGSAAVLVDAGLPDDSIVDDLRTLGVDSLRLFLASHEHSDHIGSAADVLRALAVGAYIDNGTHIGSPSEARVDSALQARGIRVAHAPRRTMTLGDATLQILPPPPDVDSLQNNHSMVLRIQRGRFVALLTGDSQRGEIERLLRHEPPGHVDVLKAPHHGDPQALTVEWLRQLTPDVVVISVGEDYDPNDERAYGVPHTRVFRTNRDGDVAVMVDAAGDYTVHVGPKRLH